MSGTGNSMQQNKMGVLPIPKLLITMGAPMMLSMLAQALYNVVDTFFVSHIANPDGIANMGDMAINALTLAFPIQILITAVSSGTGIGLHALLSQYLGRKDNERANRAAGNYMTLSIIYYIALLLFGLFACEAFIASQTSNPLITEMGATYLRIVTTFSFGTIGYMCMEKIVMSTGNTVATMIGQLTGALTNIILDPIMIYGRFGLPAMGVAGAAWATVIGQIFSFIVMSWFHFHGNKEIKNGLRYLKPDRDILKGIYTVGLPTIAMQGLAPVMSYGMNLILGGISTSAVTAFGVYYKMQNFIFMPTFGVNNACISLVSYNYGARQKERITQTIKFSLCLAFCIMLLGFLLFQFFTGQIIGTFAIADESYQLCVLALRIISCGFFFSGANIIMQGTCQALGKGTYSLAFTLMRMLVIVLPLAYIFSLTPFAGSIIWLAFPIAEGSACVAAVILTRKLCRDKVTPLP